MEAKEVLEWATGNTFDDGRVLSFDDTADRSNSSPEHGVERQYNGCDNHRGVGEPLREYMIEFGEREVSLSKGKT